MRARRVPSLRAILASWYAVILVITLAAFAVVLYSAQRRSLHRELDERIATHAAALAATTEEDAEDGLEIELGGDFLATFRREGAEQPFFVIFGKDGEVAASSRPEAVPVAEAAGFRDRGERREVIVDGQDGLRILVSEHTGKVRAKLREFLGILVVSFLGVLAVALLGGWLVSGRVLAPIRRMSDAAAEISETNLARRIDARATASELGQLAGTLNDAFDRLQAAVERQNRFTADASHELRTPLTVILVTAQQALERERDGTEYRRALETVTRAGQRMRDIVDGLLTLTRADSGALPLRKDDVDLEAVLAEAFDLLKPLAAERKVMLACSGEPTNVLGDHDRLREAFTNLLANAIRYNRPSGRVDVRVLPTNGSVRVAVEDTGIGIAERDLPHLFDRFFRVDPARSNEGGGSGLGLAITKWIVERHGGTIDVESRPGAGSTFCVTLPLPMAGHEAPSELL